MKDINFFTTQNHSVIMFWSGGNKSASFLDVTNKSYSFTAERSRLVDSNEEIGREVWGETEITVTSEEVAKHSLIDHYDFDLCEQDFFDAMAQYADEQFCMEDLDNLLHADDKADFLECYAKRLWELTTPKISNNYLRNFKK